MTFNQVILSDEKKLRYDPKTCTGVLAWGVDSIITFPLKRDELKKLAVFLNNRGEFQNKSELEEVLRDHLSDLENTSRMFNDIHNALEIIGFDKLAKKIMNIDRSLNINIDSLCRKMSELDLD